MAKTTTLQEFEAVFPKLVDDLVAHAEQYGVPTNALEWFRKASCKLRFERQMS
jgi:farnesyl diphosphate synthase